MKLRNYKEEEILEKMCIKYKYENQIKLSSNMSFKDIKYLYICLIKEKQLELENCCNEDKQEQLNKLNYIEWVLNLLNKDNMIEFKKNIIKLISDLDVNNQAKVINMTLNDINVKKEHDIMVSNKLVDIIISNKLEDIDVINRGIFQFKTILIEILFEDINEVFKVLKSKGDFGNKYIDYKSFKLYIDSHIEKRIGILLYELRLLNIIIDEADIKNYVICLFEKYNKENPIKSEQCNFTEEELICFERKYVDYIEDMPDFKFEHFFLILYLIFLKEENTKLSYVENILREISELIYKESMKFTGNDSSVDYLSIYYYVGMNIFSILLSSDNSIINKIKDENEINFSSILLSDRDGFCCYNNLKKDYNDIIKIILNR